MRESSFSQKTRFVLLAIEILILCAASQIAFGSFFPPNDERGFWFYTALLGLLLGSRLDTPFFVRPADVILYAAPAVVNLILGNRWADWNEGVRVAYVLAILFCAVTAMLGAVAVLTIDSRGLLSQKISNLSRVLAESLGTPRIIYSIIIVFALYAFHSSSVKEISSILCAWILTAIMSPLEGGLRISFRIQRLFKSGGISGIDGEIVAYQTPGLVLIRQSRTGKIQPCSLLAFNDSLDEIKIALALNCVGRDEGLLVRAIEISDAKAQGALSTLIADLLPNAVACIDGAEAILNSNKVFSAKNELVGLVTTDTSVERLYFEVVKNEALEEGRLVEVQIGERIVTYQLINGLTKEEIVQQKNTHGFARAQAQKIGEWDQVNEKFKFVKWLPVPNAPVFLKTMKESFPSIKAIGHFPGTNYPVSIKSIDDLVTHNTAILGILGVGKSMLAIELVERIIAAGIKAICIDLTNQYSTELKEFVDSENEAKIIASLKSIGASGKSKVRQNVEDGGSRTEFSNAMKNCINKFLDPNNPCRLMIFNPTQYEVWRQDSKPFSGTASMASLSPAEITQIISQATLDSAASLGMTDKARVCLVYEEAHSLVPEWNSAAADGDKLASNGSSRAILQGRKYGLGCLLITQRTANVTKTILNQCNTIFAMRTFDDTGKDFLANYIGSDYANSLPSLSERQAVIFGKASSCENPILIRLNDREKFLSIFRADNPAVFLVAKAAQERRVFESEFPEKIEDFEQLLLRSHHDDTPDFHGKIYQIAEYFGVLKKCQMCEQGFIEPDELSSAILSHYDEEENDEIYKKIHSVLMASDALQSNESGGLCCECENKLSKD